MLLTSFLSETMNLGYSTTWAQNKKKERFLKPNLQSGSLLAIMHSWDLWKWTPFNWIGLLYKIYFLKNAVLCAPYSDDVKYFPVVIGKKWFLFSYLGEKRKTPIHRRRCKIMNLVCMKVPPLEFWLKHLSFLKPWAFVLVSAWFLPASWQIWGSILYCEVRFVKPVLISFLKSISWCTNKWIKIYKYITIFLSHRKSA